jgi:hypothetical protein
VRDIQRSLFDHWKWKFSDNILKKEIVSLAVSEDKIIGGAFTHFRKG